MTEPKKYTLDYSLPAEADTQLWHALRAIADDDTDAARDYIVFARQLLQQYLNQDNMVEDNDCAPAWYRAEELLII